MLKESAHEFDVIDYLHHPPTIQELDKICTSLGMEPRELLRTKDKRFGELGLSKSDKRSRNEWLQLMTENPSLIERPIVVNKGKAALGRPPESIKNILD